MTDEILTNSGRSVGRWDGRSVDELKAELERIRRALREDASTDKLVPAGMPHLDQLPDDLHGFTAYLIWGCDPSGQCLCGVQANRVVSLKDVRQYSLIDHH